MANYVGALQERCVRERIPLPDYKLRSKTGPQHSPTFTIQATLLQYVAIGVGTTMKEAKSCSAREMLRILDDAQSVPGMRTK
jgi:dsRNA-specific ribonuclease